MTTPILRTRAAVLAVPAILLAGLLPAAPTAAAAPGAPAAPAALPDAGPPPRVEMVLDLSGSMKADDAGGTTRLQAAKQAVGRIIDSTPEGAHLGLRVYGAAYPGEDRTQGCADTQQLIPVAPMSEAARSSAKQAVSGMNAVGMTPIGVALRAAADDLGADGKRRIVLVSDGEDTCAPPQPCEVAKELKSKGIDLAVDAVGFKTSAAARDQLKCIATATGGRYADADSAEALTTNLSTLFRKAWTTYQATGTPVTGATDGCAKAPLITPGQYLDAAVTGRKQYYRVKKTPDQLLQVSATIALPPDSQHSNIEILAGPATASGDPGGWMRAFAQLTGWGNFVSAGGRTKAPDPNQPAPQAADDIGCVMVENHAGATTSDTFPMELLIGLADAKGAGRTPVVPVAKTGADAAGGMSFNSATPIGAGTVRQSIAIGDWPMWRVELKAGQRLTVTGRADVPADLPYSPNSGLGVRIVNPLRDDHSCTIDGVTGWVKYLPNAGGRVEKTCGPWEIGKADDFRTEYAGFTEPGTYYLQVGVGSLPKEALGIIVPIELTVTIDGTPRAVDTPVFDYGPVPNAGFTLPATTPGQTGGGSPGQQPGSAGNSGDLPGKSASATSDDDSGVRDLALPVGIVLACALLGAAGFYGLRRR